jgi:hypothetical protein
MTLPARAALGGAVVGVAGCIVYLTTYHLWQARYLAAKRQLFEDWSAIKRASGRWEPGLEGAERVIRIFCTVAFATTFLILLPLLALISGIVSAGKRAASLPVIGERAKTVSEHIALGLIMLMIILACALFPAALALILTTESGARIVGLIEVSSYLLGSFALAATLIPTMGEILARDLRFGFFGYIVANVVVWGAVVYGFGALSGHLPDQTKPLPWFRTDPGP